MGMATASAEGLSALFKQSELKLLPLTPNPVEKVHCRAGSFVFLFALGFACSDRECLGGFGGELRYKHI